MGRKVINLNVLDPQSIQNAINELNQYKSEFQMKVILLRNRLTNIGIDTIRNTMQSVPAKERGTYDVEAVYDTQENLVGAVINLSGDKVLFIEFSAGITYGTPPGGYPIQNAVTSQYGYGTYNPSSDNATNPDGWYYYDENGQLKHTYGNRAYMPMYTAEVAIIMSVQQVVKEVFG